MQENIFQKLYECFNKYLNIADTMRYLLLDEHKSITNKEAETYYKTGIVPNDIKEKIIQEQAEAWNINTLTGLNENSLFTHIFSIYNEYVFNTIDDVNIQDMLCFLIKYQLLNNDYLKFYYDKRKYKVCNHYQKCNNLDDFINDNSHCSDILIISGVAGSGKTQLVRKFMTQNQNIGYYPLLKVGEHNISKCIENIQFNFLKQSDDPTLQDTSILQKKEKLIILSAKNQTGTLVLEIPVLTQEDINYLKNNLCNLSVKLIITTRTPLNTKFLQNYVKNNHRILTLDMRQRSKDSIINILYEAYNANDKVMTEHMLELGTIRFSLKELSTLVDTMDYNPLVASLLGHSLTYKGEEQKQITKSTLLGNKYSLYQIPDSRHIKHSYTAAIENSISDDKNTKNSKYAMSFHLHNIFHAYDSNLLPNNSWIILCMEPGLPRHILCEIIKYTSDNTKISKNTILDQIEHIHQSGLVHVLTNDIIYTPIIIEETLWRYYPITLKYIRKVITVTLDLATKTERTGRPIKAYIDFLTRLIMRYNADIMNQCNKTATATLKTDSKWIFEQSHLIKWNMLIAAVIDKLITWQSYKSAKTLLNCMYYHYDSYEIKNDIAKHYQQLERNILDARLQLHNHNIDLNNYKTMDCKKETDLLKVEFKKLDSTIRQLSFSLEIHNEIETNTISTSNAMILKRIKATSKKDYITAYGIRSENFHIELFDMYATLLTVQIEKEILQDVTIDFQFIRNILYNLKYITEKMLNKQKQGYMIIVYYNILLYFENNHLDCIKNTWEEIFSNVNNYDRIYVKTRLQLLYFNELQFLLYYKKNHLIPRQDIPKFNEDYNSILSIVDKNWYIGDVEELLSRCINLLTILHNIDPLFNEPVT